MNPGSCFSDQDVWASHREERVLTRPGRAGTASRAEGAYLTTLSQRPRVRRIIYGLGSSSIQLLIVQPDEAPGSGTQNLNYVYVAPVVRSPERTLVEALDRVAPDEIEVPFCYISVRRPSHTYAAQLVGVEPRKTGLALSDEDMVALWLEGENDD